MMSKHGPHHYAVYVLSSLPGLHGILGKSRVKRRINLWNFWNRSSAIRMWVIRKVGWRAGRADIWRTDSGSKRISIPRQLSSNLLINCKSLCRFVQRNYCWLIYIFVSEYSHFFFIRKKKKKILNSKTKRAWQFFCRINFLPIYFYRRKIEIL